MHLVYESRKDGMRTVAHCRRHTMSRVMRRYPVREYELVDYDMAGEPIRLAGTRRAERPAALPEPEVRKEGEHILFTIVVWLTIILIWGLACGTELG